MVGNSPTSTIYGNLDIPYEELLEVNGLIPNMIILRDSSRTKEVLLRVESALPVLLIGMRKETNVLQFT